MTENIERVLVEKTDSSATYDVYIDGVLVGRDIVNYLQSNRRRRAEPQ